MRVQYNYSIVDRDEDNEPWFIKAAETHKIQPINGDN